MFDQCQGFDCSWLKNGEKDPHEVEASYQQGSMMQMKHPLQHMLLLVTCTAGLQGCACAATRPVDSPGMQMGIWINVWFIGETHGYVCHCVVHLSQEQVRASVCNKVGIVHFPGVLTLSQLRHYAPSRMNI